MTPSHFPDRRRAAEQLEDTVDDARLLAEKLGLDGYPVNYWIVGYDEMNELIAYEGFPTRYPHWRWGMQYDRQRKQDRYGAGKAFEIVVNDDPSHAYLQESNAMADQKAVITHVEAHVDFFKNNRWFGMFGDDVAAVRMLERHAERIESYLEDPEIDREAVERFIDSVLPLTDTIDQHRAYQPVDTEDDEEADDRETIDLEALGLSEEVESEVFPGGVEPGDDQEDDEPVRDVLAFLQTHGKQYDAEAGKAVEMEPWQREVLEILRREAYYFAPQQMTKVMNEGWACVAPETPVFTEQGLLPMEEVVESRTPVSDGESTRGVYDANVIPDHDTITITTQRGFELTGSNNHRVRRPDGSWIRLDELNEGDEIEVSGGNDVWPAEYVEIDWEPPSRTTLQDVAQSAGVSTSTVVRYRRVGRAEDAGTIETALETYEGEDQSVSQSVPIMVPDVIDERVGRFLGLVIGDGHVSEAAGQVGFTADSESRAEEVARLARELFDVSATVSEDGSRWRTYIYSENLVRLLAEWFEMETGAAKKRIPDEILRSPKPVVAAFIRGLFDADGHAGEQGVILSTKSEELGRFVQLLLANFGILSRRRQQTDGCYHVHLTGKSAKRFAEHIGFGYEQKHSNLTAYLDELAWFEAEEWTDEIVDVRTGTGTVHDISVEETHRYAAGGLVNHNSYYESMMMGEEAFADAEELLQYADHQSRVLGSEGLNPYKLGKELWEHIENAANRREVVEQLLRVEGVTWSNFRDAVDLDRVLELLEPTPPLDAITEDRLDELAELPDAKVDRDAIARAHEGEIDVGRHPWKLLTYEGLAERHFSLTRPRNRGVLARIGREELERIDRYLFETDRYPSVAAAIEDVEYTAGWDRLFEVRESHNDVTFLDEFLTEEFVRENEYFTYEFNHGTGDFRVASTDPEAVKRKLLLRFANFGKPTIVVEDGNYRNRNELLLAHEYNGVQLDVDQALRTLEGVFDLWGRPVNLRTILKEVDDDGREPTVEERGALLRYDGEETEVRELPWEEVADLAATEVDYDTKPDEWL